MNGFVFCAGVIGMVYDGKCVNNQDSLKRAVMDGINKRKEPNITALPFPALKT